MTKREDECMFRLDNPTKRSCLVVGDSRCANEKVGFSHGNPPIVHYTGRDKIGKTRELGDSLKSRICAHRGSRTNVYTFDSALREGG
jgi:hypothetical protein